MHSSRMRTRGGASFWGVSLLGGCLLLGGPPCRGVPPSGGSTCRGVPPSRGSPCQGGLLPRGYLLPRGVLPSRRGSPYRETPCVDRITDTSKNITLATTSLRPVINFFTLSDEMLTEQNLTTYQCINCR